MKQIQFAAGSRIDPLEAPRTEIAYDGRVRDLNFLDLAPQRDRVSGETVGYEHLPTEDPGEAITPSPNRLREKRLPGRVITHAMPPVVANDVFTSPVETGIFIPTGGHRTHTTYRRLIEPLDKAIYHLDIPFNADARLAQFECMLHLPQARRTRAVAIGLGYQGISDPADRVEDKDKIVYGGEMTMIIPAVRFPNQTTYINAGVAGKRRRIPFRFYAPTGVTLSDANLNAFSSGAFAGPHVPGLHETPDGFGVYDYDFTGTQTQVTRTEDSRSSINGVYVRQNDDAPTIIRLPWRIEFDVKFNGQIVNGAFIATGGYSFTTTFFLGKAHVTA